MYNHSLTQLNGLNGINYITGELTVRDNINLATLSGLQPDSIGGSVYVVANPSLLDLAVLEKLTTIGEDLHIGGNDLLENLNGLENLTSIGKNLKIDQFPCTWQLLFNRGQNKTGGCLFRFRFILPQHCGFVGLLLSE